MGRRFAGMLMGLVDCSTRVAPSFYLGCVAALRRPSNWLHRRFGRVKLPRPLETAPGDPEGRLATREGSRTAPVVNLPVADALLSPFFVGAIHRSC